MNRTKTSETKTPIGADGTFLKSDNCKLNRKHKPKSIMFRMDEFKMTFTWQHTHTHTQTNTHAKSYFFVCLLFHLFSVTSNRKRRRQVRPNFKLKGKYKGSFKNKTLTKIREAHCHFTILC